MRAQLEIEKLVESAPGPQTAIDLFKGRWACDLSPIAPNTVSGYARLFSDEEPGLP